MTEQLSVNAAVNGLLRLAQNQLTNTLSLIEKQVPVVEGALASELEEFNSLVDQLEEADRKIAALELQVHSQKEGNKEDLAEVQLKLNHANVELGKLRVALSGLATIEAELKKLKSMNPERLQKKNKELRSDLQEKTRLLSEAATKLKESKNHVRGLQEQVGNLTLQNSEMIQEIDHYRERRNSWNGDIVKQEFKGEDGLSCYINVFEWGLTYEALNVKAQMVNDLTWHIEVRTNFGIGIIVSVTKWLTPFFPFVATEISDNWPKSINSKIVELIIDRCSESHAHLVDRVDWTSGVPLTDVEGMNEKHIELLAAAGFHTLYSVMSTPMQQLPRLVKGLGEVSAKKVYEACGSAVREWESSNWTAKERFEN